MAKKEKDREGRRRPWPFDEEDDLLEGDVGDIFDEMSQRMERMMEEFMRMGPERSGKPFVYGYSIRVGPDGKPEVREFGDTDVVRPALKPGPAPRGREPLTDVIESGDTTHITVELPVVNKEDIDMRVTEDKIIVRVDAADRQYYKEVDLHAKVDPNSVKATFKNGILDITVKRVGGPQGHKIAIE
jgi:HSP20 family protein